MMNVNGNSCSGNGTQAIEVVAEAVTADTTWRNEGVSYVVTGDVTVRYSSYNSSTATLTIEPGVEVRFEPGTGLYIGYYVYSNRHYYGALSAQGTDGSPITFTSNAASPAPGDWKGIYFRNQTVDASTFLEHCVVEYGGHTNNSNIYCADASPTIKSSTIRNSSASVFCDCSITAGESGCSKQSVEISIQY